MFVAENQVRHTLNNDVLMCFQAPQVPSLEHNNEVRGESLDLIKYIDTHFEGPSLFPTVRYILFFHF
jgi:hypothetical protein